MTELQQLVQRILIGEPAKTLPREIGSVDDALVPAFEESFTQGRLLRFADTAADGQTTRQVEPHGLLVRAPLRYVIAWDPDRDSANLFRLT